MPWNFRGLLPTWRQKRGWFAFLTLLAAMVAIQIALINCRGLEKRTNPQRTADNQVLKEIFKAAQIPVSAGAYLQRLPAPATHASGAAMVICPSGEVGPSDSTGTVAGAIGLWLQNKGVEVFILERFPVNANSSGRSSGKIGADSVALEELKSAMRLVRLRALEWKVDTARIGVLGLGDGGRIAVQLAYHADDGNVEETDATLRMGCRPHFLALGYPYLEALDGSQLRDKGSSQPSADTTLHNESRGAAILWDRVDSTWPPLFLVHDKDDSMVPVGAAGAVERLAAAYRNNHLPLRLYAFPGGANGMGIYTESVSQASWVAKCALWLKEMGFAPNLILE
jgi:hypothetical protein